MVSKTAQNLFKNTKKPFSSSVTNQTFVDRDNTFLCKNYAPMPVACEKGERIYIWDVEGRKYFDFLCGYSACN